MRLSSGAKFSGFLMPLISWQLAQPFSTTRRLPCSICCGVARLEMHVGDEVRLGLRLQETRQGSHLWQHRSGSAASWCWDRSDWDWPPNPAATQVWPWCRCPSVPVRHCLRPSCRRRSAWRDTTRRTIARTADVPAAGSAAAFASAFSGWSGGSSGVLCAMMKAEMSRASSSLKW